VRAVLRWVIPIGLAVLVVLVVAVKVTMTDAFQHAAHTPVAAATPTPGKARSVLLFFADADGEGLVRRAPPENPLELMQPDRLQAMLSRLGQQFDWIIIDSPPALPVADASVLGGLADGVLLVVRANSTPSEASQKACKELRDAQIIGVVLNTAEESSEYNSYYSGSSYTGVPTGAKK